MRKATGKKKEGGGGGGRRKVGNATPRSMTGYVTRDARTENREKKNLTFLAEAIRF